MSVRRYRLEGRDGVTHITDEPEVDKIVRVPYELGKPVAHLALHLSDLEFALEYLHRLDRIGYPDRAGKPDIVHEALWLAALVSTYKCFGRSAARSSLEPEKIFTDAHDLENFNVFRNLRNKNVVHDDNDTAQAHVGALLRAAGREPKVFDVTAFWSGGSWVSSGNTAALRRVIALSIRWVEDEFNRVNHLAEEELERLSYKELAALPQIIVQNPGGSIDSIGETRQTPGK